ncbi:MAG: hypothetical protein WA709_23635, partial [Stellaceae bacterium]
KLERNSRSNACHGPAVRRGFWLLDRVAEPKSRYISPETAEKIASPGSTVSKARRFPTVAWGLKKDAVPFPTEADAARTIARLRPSGPVCIEPIAPEIAKPA